MEKVIVEGINKTVKHLRGRGKEHPGKKVEYSRRCTSPTWRVDEKGRRNLDPSVWHDSKNNF